MFRRFSNPFITPAPAGPATLNLTGWWEADDYNYATYTTVGNASASTSGSHDLADSVFAGAYKPTKGSGLNGHNYYDLTADYFQWLDTVYPLDPDLITDTQCSIAIYCTIEDSDTNDATAYNNRGIWGIYGGFGGWAVKNNLGVYSAQAFIYDSGANTNTLSFTVTQSTSYLLQMTLYGGTLRARVNRGSWSTISSLGISSVGSYFTTAASGGGSAKCKIQTLMIGKGLPQSDFDTIATYIEGRYGVSL